MLKNLLALIIGMFCCVLILLATEYTLLYKKNNSYIDANNWFRNLLFYSPVNEYGERVYDIGGQLSKEFIVPRASLNTDKINDSEFAVFLGCSMVYGTGLKDDQTLPFYFTKYSKQQFNAYNFGFAGRGPNTFLKVIQQQKFKSFIKETSGLFLYFHIAEHIKRANFGLHSMGYKPYGAYFQLNSEKELVELGIARDYMGFHWIKKVFSGSQLFRPIVELYQDYTNKIPPSDYSAELTGKLIGEINKYVNNNYNSRFVVIIYPQEKFPQKLDEILQEQNIEVWDFSQSKRIKKLRTHPDGWHPSAEENNLLAKILLEELQKEGGSRKINTLDKYIKN